MKKLFFATIMTILVSIGCSTNENEKPIITEEKIVEIRDNLQQKEIETSEEPILIIKRKNGNVITIFEVNEEK